MNTCDVEEEKSEDERWKILKHVRLTKFWKSILFMVFIYQLERGVVVGGSRGVFGNIFGYDSSIECGRTVAISSRRLTERSVTDEYVAVISFLYGSSPTNMFSISFFFWSFSAATQIRAPIQLYYVCFSGSSLPLLVYYSYMMSTEYLRFLTRYLLVPIFPFYSWPVLRSTDKLVLRQTIITKVTSNIKHGKKSDKIMICFIIKPLFEPFFSQFEFNFQNLSNWFVKGME